MYLGELPILPYTYSKFYSHNEQPRGLLMTMRTRARAYLNTTVHIHESSDINNCTCTRVKNRAILVAKLEQVDRQAESYDIIKIYKDRPSDCEGATLEYSR